MRLSAFYYEEFHVESCLVPWSHVLLLFFNPHLPSGRFHLYHMDESISSSRGVWCMVSFLFYF